MAFGIFTVKVNKKRLLIAIGVLFVLFVVFLFTSVAITERPEFCLTCHNMRPYYKAWRESAHKDVNCLNCHYESDLKSHIRGKIDGLIQVFDQITGRYSEKMVAKINDTSCLRSGCHVKEKLKDKKIMFKGKVEFRHATHWRDFDELGKGVHLRCTTCHMWLTFDKHIAVDENTCLICHFKNVPVEKITEQCLACHTEVEHEGEHKDYIEQGLHCNECHTTIKTTNAPVFKQMCYFCHADPEKIDRVKNDAEKAKNRELLHTHHITQNNADCMNCHELIEHGKER